MKAPELCVMLHLILHLALSASSKWCSLLSATLLSAVLPPHCSTHPGCHLLHTLLPCWLVILIQLMRPPVSAAFASFSKLQSLIITGDWEATPSNISFLQGLTCLTKLVLQPQQPALGIKSHR
jgi:hypothetical protein